MKVGDLIKHKSFPDAGTGIVTKISRNGPPDFPVHVTAIWSGVRPNQPSIEQHYLEVISESK